MAKCYNENMLTDHRNILGFWSASDSDIAFFFQISVLMETPSYCIRCVINSFHMIEVVKVVLLSEETGLIFPGRTVFAFSK